MQLPYLTNAVGFILSFNYTLALKYNANFQFIYMHAKNYIPQPQIKNLDCYSNQATF